MNIKTNAQTAQQFRLADKIAEDHVSFLSGDVDDKVLIVTADDDKDRRNRDSRIWDQAKKAGTSYLEAAKDFEGPYLHVDYGSIRQLTRTIEKRQALGCGVFILVHANDGSKKRKKEDIQTARAVWHEDDTVRPGPRALPLPATFVVESSPGKHHSYFCLETIGELSLDDADGINQRLVVDHEGDNSAKDRSRYLRLAGSWNLKPGRAPFQCQLIASNEPRFYCAAELIEGLPPMARPKTAAASRPRNPSAPLPHDAAEVRSALAAIPDQLNGSYDPWLEIGMALNDWGGGAVAALELWEEFSPDPDECAAKWASFGARTGVSIATVFHHAKGAGWSEEVGFKAAMEGLRENVKRFTAGKLHNDVDGMSDKEREAAGFRELLERIAAIRGLDEIGREIELQALRALPGAPSLAALRKTLKTICIEKRQADSEAHGDIVWPDLNAKGGVHTASINNVRAFMAAQGLVVRFELFSRRLEVGGTPMDDQLLYRTLSKLHEAGMHATAGFLRDALISIGACDTYDALTEYLTEVAGRWDGQPRVREFCATYMNADVEEYEDTFREIGLTWFIGAVGRAYEPGCKFDNILVAQSAQGWSKSHMFIALVPRPEWLMQGFRLGATAKEIIEETAGKWIVDAGELSGMKYRELEAVKDALTRTEDTGRVAFGHVSSAVKRRFISGGSTNSERPLKDTQNRRFMCVKLVAPVEIATIKRDRDQLWGEAVHLYREYVERHGSAHIKPDEQHFAPLAELAEEARETSSMEDRLRERLGGAMHGYVRSVAVANFLEIKNGHAQAYADVKTAMSMLGFTYHKAKRVGGRHSHHIPLFAKGDWNVARNHDLQIELMSDENSLKK